MSNAVTEVKQNFIEEAISEHWGDRCPDIDADCACCQAWAEYDRLSAPAHPPVQVPVVKALEGIIDRFETAYPDLYWHVAKGKICAGEPLYGAIITTLGGTEIGHGESDVSADDAFSIAVHNAGLDLPASPEHGETE